MATIPAYKTPGIYINSVEIPSPTITPIDSTYPMYTSYRPIRVKGTTQVSMDAMQKMQGTLGANLQKYLYAPMNATTDYLIRRETATTIDTYLNYGTAVSANTTGGRYITNYTITPNLASNTYDIEWDGTVTHTDDVSQLYDAKSWADLFVTPEEVKKEVAKAKFKSNLLIQVKSRADKLLKDLPQNEQVAIETLREEITESEFRKYMKYGFILVPGKSGKVYQIFRNRSHTRVWRGGKLVEEVCVRIKNTNVPPTDNVIAFKNMIQIDEEEFRKMGNLYKMAA